MSSATDSPKEVLQHYSKSLAAVRGKPGAFQSVGDTLYWLEGSPLTLYCLDTADPNSVPRKVFDAVERKGAMTREEELARERMRSTLAGISKFHIAAGGKRIYFESNGTWYVHAAREQHGSSSSSSTAVTAPLFAHESPVVDGAKVGLQFAPGAIAKASFVVRGNIFVATFEELWHGVPLQGDGRREQEGGEDEELRVVAHVEQLTTVGTELTPCGTADYIMEEEFSRYTGHWWSPDATEILFVHTDTSRLPKVEISESPDATVKMPFPRVGEPNAFSAVAIVTVATRDVAFFPQIYSAGLLEHDIEYIPRLGWLGTQGSSVFLMALDRSQEQATYVELPRENFMACTEQQLDAFTRSRSVPVELHLTNDGVRVLRSQHLPWSWVEVTDCIDFEDAVDLVLGAHDGADTAPDGAFFQLYSSSDAGATWRQLSRAGGNVVPQSVRLFRKHSAFSYLSNCDERLGRCLFWATRDADGSTLDTQRVTPIEEYVHTYHVMTDSVTEEPKRVIVVSSTATTPPAASLYSLDPSHLRSGAVRERTIPYPSQLTAESVAAIRVHAPAAIVSAAVESAPGVSAPAADAAVFLPPAAAAGGTASAGAKAPLMLYVYGGPHVQLVARSFDVSCNYLVNALVTNGIAVAVVDNRMNHANGLRSHAACKKRMGSFEVGDYLKAIDAIKSSVEVAQKIDFARIGIMGWSYGGYATLLAMSQAPSVFKVGFAGAPVGSWRLYDTGYTERYMGLLPEAAEAYDASAISSFARGFPDELGRLFLAQGMSDENVHFAHMCGIIDALVRENKPYSLLLYPGERHGLRQKPESRAHYDLQLLRNVLAHL